MLKRNHFTFKHASPKDFELILGWFIKPHVQEFWDDPVTGKTIPDLKKFLAGEDHFWTHWLGYINDKPFAYLTTAEVTPTSADADIYQLWREKVGQTYSLDIFIGEEKYLGKGLASLLIKSFIANEFSHAAAFLIDPEKSNTRAIRVYEKAGFKIVGEFTPQEGQFAGHTTLLMKLPLNTSVK